MGYQLITGAISSSVGVQGGHYTGSFIKILAMGADDAEIVIDRIEFGNLVEPESAFTPTGVITGSMTFAAGTYIDGPIARFNIKSGAVLAYYHKFIGGGNRLAD